MFRFILCEMNLLKTYLTDFVSLLFPDNCVCCNRLLTMSQNHICSICEDELPYTKENLKNHYLADKLMAIQPILGVFSALYYHPENTVGAILNQLKYRQRKELGFFLGKILANELRSFTLDVDLILPVPLHATKLAKRGYNQSELLVQELSKQLAIPMDTEHLIRIENTKSQTKKSRQERYKTMQNVFQVKEQEFVQGKSILLIDDVVTTGATMLSCAEVLFQSGVKSVTFATAAKPYPF